MTIMFPKPGPKKGKHRQIKATDISQEVQKIVAERDSINGRPCCIFCGSPNAKPEMHYIPRSHGGLGIPENIGTGCRLCHDKLDGREREKMLAQFKEYLMNYYPDWSEEKLIYKKG